MSILVTDPKGIILTVNPYTLKEFGYAGSELPDQRIGILIPGLSPELLQHGLTHKDINLQAVKKGGTEFAVDIDLSYCENKGEKYVIIFVNNVSDHGNSEADPKNTKSGPEWEVNSTKDLKETLNQLEATNLELNKAMSFRDAILQNAGAIIISGDTNGIIQTFNPEAERELGYKAEELIGKQSVLIFHDVEEVKKRATQISKELKKNILAGTEVFFARTRLGMHNEYEWTYLRKDGTTFPVLLTVTAMKNEKNEIIGFMGVAINISEQKKIEKELQKSLDKEKELGELKSRFVSIASHEFRTPLSTVLLSAYLIEKYVSGDDQPKREKHLQRIITSVTMLTEILNDFLSVGKIEEGKIQVRYSEFNMVQVMQGFIEELKSTLKKGQEIFYGHEGEPLVTLDTSMMRRIILNLVSNASKFSGECKPIEIKTQNCQNQIILSVKDYGIGISKDDQKHLMERFFRGANAGNIQGTGLGIHIVSKYAELMDGMLACKSELEKGTEFVITFNKLSSYEKDLAD